MASIARLIATLRPAFRFVAPSPGAAPAETAQAHHHYEANLDDIDRLRAFEMERVRRNPASLLSPRL
jgi:hypothetical protein